MKKRSIERTMQYIKDRTECFDDYFPCRKKNCKLKYVLNQECGPKGTSNKFDCIFMFIVICKNFSLYNLA
jgi:hypothetical protein